MNIDSYIHLPRFYKIGEIVIAFLVSGLSVIIFSILNPDLIKNWKLSFFYGLLFIIAGGYLSFFSVSVMVLAFISIVFSLLVLGTLFDIYHLTVRRGGYLVRNDFVTVLVIALGVVFSFMILVKDIFMGMAFITMGLSMTLLSVKFRYMPVRNRKQKSTLENGWHKNNM